jgi:hypothetical protein
VDQQTVGRTRRIRKSEARKQQAVTRIAPQSNLQAQSA